MGKGFFQFKEFTVWQDRCAMKVCQDSCAFGAWVEAGIAKRVLDIGSGTGLLSLMLAQRTQALITAIEIDAEAAAQCDENVAKSPFSSQIFTLNSSLEDFSQSCRERFGLVVCNPPFYQNHLCPTSKQKRMAHHDGGLLPRELLEAVLGLISPDGRFALMYPPRQSRQFEERASERGLRLIKRTIVHDREGSPAIRHFDLYSPHSVSEPEFGILVFKDDDGQFTPNFTSMMRSYYLDR